MEVGRSTSWIVAVLASSGLLVGPAGATSWSTHTTITGFDEHGLPRIKEGDDLVATIRERTASGGRYKVVADSISRAP